MSENIERENMPIYKFTPDLDFDTLKEITVGRGKLVNHILEELKSAAEGNYRNHYLIVGPRGIGKTHFILLLHHAIKNGELSDHFIPIKFAEEEYSIISINHLFSRAVQRLCKEEGQGIGEMQEILTRPLFKDVEHALEALRRLKKETGKRLLLMLENLHLVFDAIGKQGISRLRSILQEEDTFTIIGTAPVILDEVADARQPLYHFFKQETLPALTDPQTMELLQKLENKTGQTRIDFKSDGSKIKALNKLTGGYPRLILWLYDILAASRIIDVEKNLLSLLDELSSYYTLRMEGMPPQQRATFDAIAQFHEPVGPKQLSEEVGLEARKVSTLLQRMVQSGYVRKVYPGKRRKRALYEITDRLFRYWREIREPFGRERIGLLIRFFKLWYGPEERTVEFERQLEQAMGAYREGKSEFISEHLTIAGYLTDAAAESQMMEMHGRLVGSYKETGLMDDAEREIERLMRKGKELGRKEFQVVALIENVQHFHGTGDRKKLRTSINEFVEFDKSNSERWKIKAKFFDGIGLYHEALLCYDKLIELAPSDAGTWLEVGIYYNERGRSDKALAKYEHALELYEKLYNSDPGNVEYLYHIAGIQSNIGNILRGFGRRASALEKYGEALEKIEYLLSGKPEDTAYRSNVAMTCNNLGILLSDLGRREEAREHYQRALDFYEALMEKDPDIIVLQSYVATSSNLGNLLSDLGRREEAKEHHQRALEMSEVLMEKDPDNIVLQSDVATCSNNLGNLLRDLGEEEEARQHYQRALEMREALLGKDPDNIVLQSYVATSSNNLGVLLGDMGKREEARQHYQRALEMREALMEKDPDNIVLQSDVAMTCNNLGTLLGALGKREEARQHHQRALEMREVLMKKDPDNIVLQSYVATSCYNLGTLLGDLGQFDEAEEFYRKASIYESVLPDKGVIFRIARSSFFKSLKRENDAVSDGIRALDIARNLGWKVEMEYALSYLISLHFTISLDSLSGNDPRKAHEHLSGALAACKETSTERAQVSIVSFLRSISSVGNLEFINEALSSIIEILGKEYAELLKPYSKALEFAMTGDPDVLLTLQQEQREVAREIAGMMAQPEEKSDSEKE